MENLEQVFDDCQWDAKFEHSTPSIFNATFSSGDELSEFLEETQEEDEDGFWSLHLGSWSNGERVVALYNEFE